MKHTNKSKKIIFLGAYDDFYTIDWLREMSKNRLRQRQITNKMRDSLINKIKKCHDKWSGWLVVVLVGLAAGNILNFKKVQLKFSSLDYNKNKYFCYTHSSVIFVI